MTWSRPREWLSLDDEISGDRWLFDATFLLSPWTCVYGRGCRGIIADEQRSHLEGCCSYGAHLADEEDRNLVAEAAARLTDEQWENRYLVVSEADLFRLDDDGDTLTELHDDACIFLNSPAFAGGAGCALHVGAKQAHEALAAWKPRVCWQLPLYVDEFVEDSGRNLFIVRAWEPIDWGPAGEDFGWWCTSEPDAYVGEQPVYVTLCEELQAILGESLSNRLSLALDERVATEAPVRLVTKSRSIE